MSKNGEGASNAARALTSPNTVLDFLYYDARRVGSYLAQFDPAGHLQGFKEQEQHGSVGGFKSLMAADLAVPAIAKAAGSHETTGQKSEGGQAERQYDPFWVNALSFLDYIEDRQLCHDDLERCPLGHFVRMTGSLSIVDVGFIKRVVSRPPVKQAIMAGSYTTSKREAEDAGLEFNELAWKMEIEVAMEMVDELPSTITASIIGDQKAWASLKAEGMATDPGDILLQHGDRLPGEWEAIGILSAVANEGDPPRYQTYDEGEAMGSALGIRALIPLIAPMARNQVGRPHDAYGFTPLLIYRTVHSRHV